jgi:Ca2+ transporting ATPase
MNKKYTREGYRAIAFAYKDIPLDDFIEMKNDSNNFESQQDRLLFEQDLVFVGLFALKNDLRKKVFESVQLAQKGGCNVRMISGDNLETCKSVAIKAGIICKEDAERHNVCLNADEFRKKVGTVRITVNPDDNSIVKTLTNFEAFKEIAASLRVLCRAEPEDKYLMVVGLK